jgi:hypothetical protein
MVEKKTPVGPLDLVRTARSQEFEADKIAMDILLKGYDAGADSDPRHFDVAARIAGTTFFFSLDAFKEAVRQSVDPNQVRAEPSDHPPSPDRVRALLDYAAARGLPDGSLDLAEAILAWLDDLQGEVVEIIGGLSVTKLQ